MALTAMEAVKVVGGSMKKIGETGEAFENANPGQTWKPTRTEVIELVIETASALGVEIQD
ncbi:MAG: hypothetical protein WC433_06505 [Candidatus Omnitrophota bacterium]|jgi:hypothetical protein